MQGEEGPNKAVNTVLQSILLLPVALLRGSNFGTLLRRFSLVIPLKCCHSLYRTAATATTALTTATDKMARSSVITAFRRSVRYRLGRFYNSFHYSQSNNKYVMLFVFPSVMWYTRYRADTKLGYRLYIAPTAGGPIDYQDKIDASSIMKQAEADSEESSSVLLKTLNYVDDVIMGIWQKLTRKSPLIDGFKNGKKVYLQDSATVADLKRVIYGQHALAYADVLVGCKGRVMQNNDNLALSTRAFCKRDPRIVLWRDA